MYKSYLVQLEEELDELDKNFFDEEEKPEEPCTIILEDERDKVTSVTFHDELWLISAEQPMNSITGGLKDVNDLTCVNQHKRNTQNASPAVAQRNALHCGPRSVNGKYSRIRRGGKTGTNNAHRQPPDSNAHRRMSNSNSQFQNGTRLLKDDKGRDLVSKEIDFPGDQTLSLNTGGHSTEDKISRTGADSPNLDPVHTVIKLVLLGEPCTGKTSILRHVFHDGYRDNYHFTIGLEFQATRSSSRPGVEIQIWDTPGKESCKPPRDLMKKLFKDTDAFVIVYDVTDMTSFEKVSSWCDLSRTLWTGSRWTMIVGNKSDLPEKTVPTSLGQSLADKYCAGFWEMSAKEGDNVDECFNYLETVIFQ